jgi:lambda repressor-like predicted transcriptional regulator
VDLLTRYSNHEYTGADLDEAVARAKTPRLVPTQPPAQPHAMAQRLDDGTRRRIANDYRAGMSPPLIGSRYGISRNSVMDIVAGLGVPRRRPNMQPQEVAAAVDLYQSGWSLARVGKRLGFDPTTIRNRLLEHGVEMRNCHAQLKGTNLPMRNGRGWTRQAVGERYGMTLVAARRRRVSSSDIGFRTGLR